jgi:dihydrodipicolinate synthase/N-acetylneuraminate lyase
VRILVTGGAGRLGRSVVAALVGAGHEVLSADRDAAPELPVEQVALDLTDRTAVDDVFTRFAPDAVIHLAAISVPFSAPEHVILTARASGRDDLQLFNGLLTAEWTQGAYRALGIPLYSSAAFAMAPAVATAYYDAYTSGDEARRLEILERFYLPLVKLRDEVPGFGVALIKAGLRLGGMDVGGVRPPLTDPDPRQTDQLERILAIGKELAA